MAGPFGPPDPRSETDRIRDLGKLMRQIVAVQTARQDRRHADNHLAEVQRRREGRTDRTQFSPIPDSHGESTLVVNKELLIREESVDAGIEGVLSAQGLSHTPIGGELGDKVHRVTGALEDVTRLASFAAALRRQGVAISANYVTPMGPFTKSVAGPVLSDGPAPARPDGASAGADASEVRVVIIDTGVVAARGDGWLTGLQTPANMEDLDDAPPYGYLDFGAGHGTFCAGIVQQIAPSADIAVVKELDSDGYMDEVRVASAMVRAAREGLAAGKHVLINLSLGTETADDERPVALGVAVELIEDMQHDSSSNPSGREVLIVAAAGNYGRDRPCYPAALPGVVAVGALTQGLLPADWSSRGAWVDVSTIGEGVRSTFVTGMETPGPDRVVEEFPESAWALWTGTSFAAPQVTGAIASIALDGPLTLTQAKRELMRGAPEVPLYGKRLEILRAIASTGE